MKIFAIFALFALASCQERNTVTEDLLAAQAELTISHEFTELFLVQNRQRLSDYLERIELIALEQFMGAYAAIKNKGIETREAMEEFTEPSFCKDNVRARWELQVTRYGQKLSQCLDTTANYLFQFTGILNRLHHESRAYSVVVPNASVNVLTRIDIFDGRDNLSTYINNELRHLIFRSLDFYNEFEEFIDGISINVDNLIEQYTECYRTLPVAFNNESDQDLLAIARCYSD